jgi:N-dimethylarginine dimethylaminohydrolase
VTIQDAIGRLRQVYVRPPQRDDQLTWQAYGWKAAPDPTSAAGEHEAFHKQLAAAGAEIVLGREPVANDPDAIYAYDPVLVTDAGAILLRPGKAGRRAEPEAVARDLERAGISVVGTLHEPATAEGGDLFWLDATTLLAGVGYRTNSWGVSQLRELLGPDIHVHAFDLPHLHGADECLHLMSLVSMLDRDLAVGYRPLMPVRLVQLLHHRGVEIVDVPDEEFSTMGPNVLALAPRVGLALEGNPETRGRMEAAGVEVRTYAGNEISRKGDGGPTCLTRPLARG